MRGTDHEAGRAVPRAPRTYPSSQLDSGAVRTPRPASVDGFFAFACIWLLTCTSIGAAVIHSGSTHLRSGDRPEWEEFARQTPDGRRLDLTFNSRSNASEATLFIRQDEVRQDWPVELNGKRIGRLFTMEADLVHTLTVPAGLLRDGENRLSMVPPRNNDDIFIHQIVLDPRSPFAATAEATVEVRVTEGRKDLPCRITIVDSNNALAALVAITNAAVQQQNSSGTSLALRPGVVYTGNGVARLGLRAGDYTIYASRGFEYSVATQRVHIAVGDNRPIRLSLRREVETRGFVSCDTHIHTFTFSGHGDCRIDERMLTLAGEGIEFPIAADHNTNIDYELPAQRTGTRSYFTPVMGEEVTTTVGHFNIFPVNAGAKLPNFKLTDWTLLHEQFQATPGVRVVVLNHPRNVHNNFQPFAATNYNAVTGENRRGGEFQFDAMELLNSSAQQSDYMLVYRDWFGLLNHGYRVTGAGSSDSHDVSRYIVGQGRTYIQVADGDVSRIDAATACSNLVAGRALVSMGLLAQMTVNNRFRVGDIATNPGKELRVQVEVLAPSWIAASRVELFANGMSIRTNHISPRDAKSRGVKAVVAWTIPKPAHDVHLVALAIGPGVNAPFWATPKPYQPTSPGWTNRVFAVTNPIWIDADGDGQFTSARGYAKRLVQQSGADGVRLVRALAAYDEAVAAQAASLCAAAGIKLGSADPLLRSAAPQVQRGFAAYARGKW